MEESPRKDSFMPTVNPSPDMLFEDLDGDGVHDLGAVDTTGDGTYDTVLVDSDGDGLFDIELRDLDGDGAADVISYDTDGDGLTDYHEFDYDGDGTIDAVIAEGPGTPSAQQLRIADAALGAPAPPLSAPAHGGHGDPEPV